MKPRAGLVVPTLSFLGAGCAAVPGVSFEEISNVTAQELETSAENALNGIGVVKIPTQKALVDLLNSSDPYAQAFLRNGKLDRNVLMEGDGLKNKKDAGIPKSHVDNPNAYAKTAVTISTPENSDGVNICALEIRKYFELSSTNIEDYKGYEKIPRPWLLEKVTVEDYDCDSVIDFFRIQFVQSGYTFESTRTEEGMKSVYGRTANGRIQTVEVSLDSSAL